MPLQKQAITVDLLGLDQKSPTTTNIPGSLDTLENAVISKASIKGKPAIELRKRFGSRTLPTTIVPGDLDSFQGITSGTEINTFKGQLVLRNGDGLYAYSQGDSRWFRAGGDGFGALFPASTVKATPIAGSTNQFQSPDQAVWNDIVCTVFVDASSGESVYWTLHDRSSGVTITPATSVDGNAEYPRVVTCAGYFFLFYRRSGSDFYCVKIDPRSGTAGLPVSVGSIASGTSMDVTVSGTSMYLLGYQGTNIFCTKVSADPAITASSSVFGYTGDQRVMWLNNTSGDGYLYLAAVSTTTGLSRIKVDPNSLGTASALILDAALTTAAQLAGYYDGNSTNVVREQSGDTTRTTHNGVSATTSTFFLGSALSTRLFQVNGTWYVGLTYASDLQSTNFLVEVTSRRIVSKFFPNTGSIAIGGGNPAEVAVSGSVAFYPSPRKTRIISQGRNNSAGLGPVVTYSVLSVYRVEHDFAGSLSKSTQLGNSLYLNGAQVWQYDGATVVEAGFHLGPEPISHSGAGGGPLTAGAYQYVCVFEDTDANGDVLRSNVSTPVQVTSSGGDSFNIIVKTLKFTNRSNVSVAIYRTTSNGANFYKVTDDFNPVLNVKTATDITFHDTTSDANLQANQPLYTTGGVLPNIGAPSGRISCVHKNRLFVIDEEDVLWFSKERIPGLGLEFDALNRIELPREGGSVVGVYSMDQTLVVFKTSGILQITGDFPGPTGQGTFPPVLGLGTPLGLSGPNAVASSEAGLIFQDRSGKLWLLGRGSFNLAPIGGPVEDETAAITSAVTSADPLQVRFFTAEGRTLVYDVTLGQWSVFTNQQAVSATYWNGVPSYLDSSGTVHYEAPGTWDDSGASIVTRIGLSEIGFAGIKGYARVWRLQLRGKYCGAHHLKLTVFYDGSEIVGETFDSDWPNAAGAVPYGYSSPYGSEPKYGQFYASSWNGVWNPEFKFANQQCESIRLVLEDSFPSGVVSEGFRLQVLGFLVGLKQGQGKSSTRIGPS